MGERKVRKMNAARVCFGISRIGYTPASAICDITDNSVSHHANNVHIKIRKKNAKANNNRKNNVEEYLIIDDGEGMSLAQLENALDLGSDDTAYEDKTLSKFGLGLKAASFAQGDRLEVISGDGKEIHKQYVDLTEIEDDYFSVEEELNEEDLELIKRYFKNENQGTIVRITKIKGNHPAVKLTIDELKEKIGVIYYYFLNKDLHIFLDEGTEEEIRAFDPLLVEEAGDNNLDENVWDGKSVQWLLRPTDILLDADSNVVGKIEITMLPHPRVFKSEGMPENAIRQKYHISASNYGFYVYRNGRLINWANRLDIIPQDQDFYSFRGRINIDSSADDAFNINVSKSHINLSEDARTALDDYVADYKRKCKNAWNGAFKKYQAQISQDSNELSNNVVGSDDGYLDSIPDDDDDEFTEEFEKRDEQIREESKAREVEDTINRLSDENDEEKTEEQITEEEISETMTGRQTVSSLDKIFRVTTITDNKLWEPYVDASRKECVRISKNHRFAKLIYENNVDNKDLQVLFELLMYIEAKAELQVRKEYQDVSMDKVTEILDEYRLAISEKLAKLCRKEEDNLPPFMGA